MGNNKNNIQILLETMTKCGGNCSGCALSSVERMDTYFDLSHFIKNSQLVQNKLLSFDKENIESITVFLGQGDHFLMPTQDIERFVQECSNMIPDYLKNKTVVFITASAIGKEDIIRQKMDLFYEYSIKYNIPFFIQTVFDPKKIKLTKKFKDIYLRNILYFKEKCGMTEITINLGQDLINFISPLEFHNWVKNYKFNHIEFNWVINQFTLDMWSKSYKNMHKWLQEWLLIYREEPSYEINFLPFMARHFKWNNVPLLQMNRIIQNELNHNFYFDYEGNEFFCQYGFISNLTPFGERLNKNKFENSNRLSKNILTQFMKNTKCSICEFNNVCSISGVEVTFDYWKEAKKNNLLDNEMDLSCPWDIYSFMKFFKEDILDYIDNNSSKNHMINTTFTKNPIQNNNIILQHSEGDIENSTFEYFDECRIQRINNGKQ